MNSYSNYKPSGIDWIGDIPSHWEVKKLKYVATIFGRIGFRGYTVDDIVTESEGVVTISPSNIKGDVFTLENSTYISYEKYYESPEIMIFPDDIILVKTGSTIGKTAIIPEGAPEMTLNPQLIVLKKIQLDPKYLYYQTACEFFKSSFEIEQTGSTTPTISQEKVNNFPILYFPFSEQTAIARFLDEKTAQLDTLVDRKRRLIDLLREEKTALINEAVTKGINPNVPTKDSGIEWLGEVPAHWEVKKLKHVATVRSGFALNGTMGGEKGIKLPYLRVANVQDGYLKLHDVTEVEIDPGVALRYYLQPGDLLMNEGGDNDKLGRGCVWRGEIAPCLHQNHVFAVRMKEGINSDWINLLTLTTYARQYFFINCKQSTNLASISQTNIKELSVLIPPEYDQKEIITYLDTDTAKIDHTISRIEREIELMQEYRTVLISEVVTGKVKVV